MDLTTILNVLGTGFFAISGALAGIRNRMDLLGVVIMGFFVGLGGGTICNICLGIPPVWLKDVTYVWAVVAPSLITFAIMWHFRQHGKKHLFSKRTAIISRICFLTFDAFGLGLFAITGTQLALHMGVGTVGSMLMGMITAVGGGMIRDLCCNDIPLIFQRDIYATAALIGGGIYIAIRPDMPMHSAEIFSVVLVIVIRLVSVYRNWQVPRIGEESPAKIP